MPTTINGIGTMYYGKKNVQTRGGVCEHCGEVGDLRSYQTRLWVTFVFIPVVPLGKKQIIDECPSCRRHRLVPVGQWQNLARDDLSESRAATDQDPQDEEAALDHFELAWRLGAAEEADRLAGELPGRFPNSAEVQITLGSWHEAVGRNAQADACFAEALRLDPDSKQARRAVGIALVEQGQLADARTLLAFMDEPGADQDAKVLAMLGKAYHEQGDHEQALDFLARAAKASPEFMHNKHFRKMVKAAQAAMK